MVLLLLALSHKSSHRQGRLPGDTPERDTRILQLFSFIVQGTYILGLQDLAKNLYCDYFVMQMSLFLYCK